MKKCTLWHIVLCTNLSLRCMRNVANLAHLIYFVIFAINKKNTVFTNNFNFTNVSKQNNSGKIVLYADLIKNLIK